MSNKHSTIAIAALIWILTNLILGLGISIYFLLHNETAAFVAIFIVAVIGGLCSLPVLGVLTLTLKWIEKLQITTQQKFTKLFVACCLCTTPYGIIGGLLFGNNYSNDFTKSIPYNMLLTTLALFGCSVLAILLINKKNKQLFLTNTQQHFYGTKSI